MLLIFPVILQVKEYQKRIYFTIISQLIIFSLNAILLCFLNFVIHFEFSQFHFIGILFTDVSYPFIVTYHDDSFLIQSCIFHPV